MDARIRELAENSPNFGYLLEISPKLVAYGTRAEVFLADEPGDAMIKCRQFLEELVRVVVVKTGTGQGVDSLGKRVQALSDADVVSRQAVRQMRTVLRSGNKAVHEDFADPDKAAESVRCCFWLGDYVARHVFGDTTRRSHSTPAARPANRDTGTEVLTAVTHTAAEIATIKRLLESIDNRITASEPGPTPSTRPRRTTPIVVAGIIAAAVTAIALTVWAVRSGDERTGPEPPTAQDCPAAVPIKGNISSAGERIYHLPGGSYYTRTNAERCFDSAADAESEGFRPARR
ncbi:DUF4145 domain-containing protein [Yinghuangia sp. ASG 101]|uniref:sunset domain-containing protein n=1 Tax=Yinghuangia sp. ASG 101 TaxID=2896848 RepID=UPI001E4F7BC7|nr:DUF4145 domain-containing protein [Yinghuangia sp. ASG 101]UGQ13614.1 DUF4145 domain-containing protein [Yinghuangia sp. ASG 101]